MKNPLSRARSRSQDTPDETAPDGTDATDGAAVDGEADDPWSAYRPDGDGPADGPPVDGPPVDADAPVDVDTPADDRGDDAGDGEPSVPLAARLAGLLGATRRAQLVVVAVALLIGPSAGAGVRATLAAAVPRPAKPAPVEVEREPDDEGTDDTVATVDDGRRRYLVALSPRTATTTVATRPSAATTIAGSAPTTGVASTRATTLVTLPPSPFPVTIVAGEETQWADVVRLDGSRVVVLLPTRYLRLVPESDPARATFALTTERSLVKDRDGRYWATARDGMDAALYELPGQLPPAPVRESTHEDPAHEATADEGSAHEDAAHEDAAHEDAANGDAAHEAATDHATTGTTHGTAGDGHAATTDAHGSSSGDGHGTEAVHTALPTIPRSTTTTLPPAPPALVEPVPLADRETAILLASLPGVEEVKALGPGVFAVIGILDPADLEAVPGVASVREDAGWRTPS